MLSLPLLIGFVREAGYDDEICIQYLCEFECDEYLGCEFDCEYDEFDFGYELDEMVMKLNTIPFNF